jgi:small subunit ribosomal protein S21
MTYQEKKDGESFEQMYKRFKRGVKREGTLQELRQREFFVKNSEDKKVRKKAAERRTRIQQRADELF